MQKFSTEVPPGDRSVVRKWRFAVAAFYGSLLTLMVVMAFLSERDVQFAKSDIPREMSRK